jgi:Xaa-Pro aminopeptidase
MAKRGYDAYIINSADAHQSEYVPAYWRTRAWLSGFTGSNGLVAVTKDAAGLWTDGRYFIQAEAQLAGSGIDFYKIGEEGVPTYSEWLARELSNDCLLAFDGRTFSVSGFEELQKKLTGKNIKFAMDTDLIGEIWTERPSIPASKAFLHEPRFTGLSAAEKLQSVRDKMGETNWYLVTALDSVAWLLNIRGRDIPQTPVVYAYALIGKTEAHVFIDPLKTDGSVTDYLNGQGFTLHPYDDIYIYLSKLEGTLQYNPDQVNALLVKAVPADSKVKKETDDIIGLLKAVKNETEIKNIRNAFIKDGVVWVRLLMWLEDWAEKKETALYEADVADKLHELRQTQADYLEPSFDTISAYMANAASMHYSPENRGAEIKPEGFLLVDTGAQYLDGTTDITRTLVMGNVTDEMKRDFTLVLKGHIALASTIFLFGTTGAQLDAIPRVPLWAAGMNYRSGTGHGLGFCLGVHEGPHGISMRQNAVKLKTGMLVTNEPGVYKEGRHGIRTENVLLVGELFKNEDGTFMGFENISFCPIDIQAINPGLLTEKEKTYLNEYHRQVYENLAPHLTEPEKDWLTKATKQI